MISFLLLNLALISSPLTKITYQSQALDLNNFVLIELFTSQGCSSCPPADKTLGNIIESAKTEGKSIFALSFHVDYWDYLGWKDPYGQTKFSERQHHYANLLEDGRVYTPQMIVNGETFFVGSNRPKANAIIQKKLREQPSNAISFTATINSDNVKINYTLRNNIPDTEIHIALAHNLVTTQIKRGENKSRQLSYHNVVTDFHTFYNNGLSGSWNIDLPDDHQEDLTVIIYQQNKTSGKIIAAAQSLLKQPSTTD